MSAFRPDQDPGVPGPLPTTADTTGIVGPVPAMSVRRRVDASMRPDLKRAIPALLLAVVVFVVGANLGGIGRNSDAAVSLFGWSLDIPAGWVILSVVGLAVLFVVLGIIAGRSIAKELARVSSNRAGVAAGSAIRLTCVIITYITVGLGLLAMLKIDLGNLLVGGAVTGIVVGIAAQQTLGNFFAGIVLLFARPYVPGQRVKVHTGAMGGPFVGTIVGAGILYTFLETDTGIVTLPNSGLLASAFGPADPVEAPEPTPVPGDSSSGPVSLLKSS